ncbi:MAG: phosphoadenylyl-sulfate reductase [Planctomycetota bacterium]
MSSTTITDSITESFEDKFVGLSAEKLLDWAIDEFGDSLAVSTSFGIQSAVTLHLATSLKPDLKVIWVDTGYLPAETHAYAEELTRRLNLNLHVYRSPINPPEFESRFGRLWESVDVEDLNLYDQIRKVEPMQRALEELNVRGWVSGLRASQTDFRKRLPPLKRTGSRYRVYPILDWSNRDTYYYMEQHQLPQHPLFAKGYATVGDIHSSRPLTENDEDERDTRFRGLKQECGLHLF